MNTRIEAHNMYDLEKIRDTFDQEEIEYLPCSLCSQNISRLGKIVTMNGQYCLMCWTEKRSISEEITIEW